MSVLLLETPGLIDLRAFTLMGVSAKPGAALPIGKFGTGLKYSVACLVRWDTNPVVWIGEDKYTFKKSADTFRGQNFYGITMVRQRFGIGMGRYTKLAYTTLYGREWKPWMVYRELEANTRDEGGSTTLVDNVVSGKPGFTRIVVDNRDVIEAYLDSAKVFLPDGQREGSGVQVIDQPSQALYWRGMKVYDLPKQAQRTYNILDDITLTEDRTLGSEWLARYYIGQWLLTQADRAQVQDFITADEEYWEHEFELDVSTEPGPAFKEIMVARPTHQGQPSRRPW